MRRAAVGIVAIVLLSACGDGGEDASEAEPTALSEAHDVCSPRLADDLEEKFDQAPDVADVMKLEKDGGQLTVSWPEGRGDVVARVLFDATECVLEDTEAPVDLLDRFADSRPTGGKVGEYGDIKITWYLGDQSYNRIFQSEFEEG